MYRSSRGPRPAPALLVSSDEADEATAEAAPSEESSDGETYVTVLAASGTGGDTYLSCAGTGQVHASANGELASDR